MAGGGSLQKGKAQFRWIPSSPSPSKRKRRMFEFLAGVNVELNQVRVQILGRGTPLSLNEVFSVVRGEKSQQAVTLETGSNTNLGSTLASPKGNGWRASNKPSQNRSPNRDNN